MVYESGAIVAGDSVVVVKLIDEHATTFSAIVDPWPRNFNGFVILGWRSQCDLCLRNR